MYAISTITFAIPAISTSSLYVLELRYDAPSYSKEHIQYTITLTIAMNHTIHYAIQRYHYRIHGITIVMPTNT